MGEAPSFGRMDGRTHELPVRVYYEDTDFSGFVYHANYLRYFERGRSDFLRLAGVDHVALLALDTAITVLGVNLKFARAARIDDALLVRTRMEAIKGVRLFISQTLMRGEDLIAQGELEACCISIAGRAKRAPALLVEKIGPFLDSGSSRF